VGVRENPADSARVRVFHLCDHRLAAFWYKVKPGVAMETSGRSACIFRPYESDLRAVA